MRRHTTYTTRLCVEWLEPRSLLDALPVPVPSIVANSANASAAQQSSYYVSNDGSNDNSGTSEHDAFLTINAAIGYALPGDTVFVLPGLYPEEFVNIPGGTDWDNSVRLVAYDHEVRPILRPGPGSARVFTFASLHSSYIEIDGFVIDASNVTHDAIKITAGSETGGSHHIRIKNSEVMNAPEQGILVTGGQFGVGHHEFVNLDIHGNGTTSHDHGVYISTPHNIVEQSRIYQNSGWGIHNYGGDPSYNVYRDNEVYDHGEHVGIGIYNGTGVEVSNNVVWGNKIGINVRYGASNTSIFNNVSYQNFEFGIEVGTDITDVFLTNNTLHDNPSEVAIWGSSIVSISVVASTRAESTSIDGPYKHPTESAASLRLDGARVHRGQGSEPVSSFSAGPSTPVRNRVLMTTYELLPGVRCMVGPAPSSKPTRKHSSWAQEDFGDEELTVDDRELMPLPFLVDVAHIDAVDRETLDAFFARLQREQGLVAL